MPSECTCQYEDDGTAESGPSLSVDYDEDCPTHGREAEPQKWAEADRMWSGWDPEAAEAQRELTVDPLPYQVYDPSGANIAEAEDCRGAMNAIQCLAAERGQDPDRFRILHAHDPYTSKHYR